MNTPDSKENFHSQESVPQASVRAWPRRLQTTVVMFGLLTLVCWCVLPQLPKGVCFGDSGDLQLASATLGIAHPPGYAGYTTIGYLLISLFGTEPAYVVSVACFVTGLVVLVVCLLFQLQLGVGTAFAATMTLALAAHPRFWTNLRAPEVYMPTLALVVSSGYFLLRYGCTGRRASLLLAVLLFGAALGNRPPVLFLAPFFLIVWNQFRSKWNQRWRDLAWMIPLAVAPTVYSLAYVYVRDEPELCYNYIDNHNEEKHVLPQSTEGAQARLRRSIWQISGEQFREYMGTNWRGVVGKLRWLQTQVAYGSPFTDVFVFLLLTLGIEPPAGRWYPQLDVYVPAFLALIGLWITFRRSRATGWLLTGLAVSCIVFVLAYKVFGQAADLLPLLFAETVALGVLGSKVFPSHGHWVRGLASFALAIGAGVLFANHIPARGPNSTGVYAGEYLRELDLASFPGPAVICAEWPESVPIRYAQCVQAQRRDLHVVTSAPDLWTTVYRSEVRPVFVTDVVDLESPCSGEPFRNVFRMHCSEP